MTIGAHAYRKGSSAFTHLIKQSRKNLASASTGKAFISNVLAAKSLSPPKSPPPTQQPHENMIHLIVNAKRTLRRFFRRAHLDEINKEVSNTLETHKSRLRQQGRSLGFPEKMDILLKEIEVAIP